MIMINGILTKRSFERDHSFDIIYEWEDVISKINGIALCDDKALLSNKFGHRIPFLFKLLMEDNTYFQYDMYADISIHRNRNVYNMIPCVIDFYCKKDELKKFEDNYKKNPIVFISSKEAYDFLKDNDCQLNFHHLPLSLSDSYKGFIGRQKIYDVAVMGRRNPVLMSFLEQYSKKRSGLKIVMNGEIDGKRVFCTQEKEFVSENSRANWFDVLSRTKVVFYHTPGVDGGEARTNGFNQVTPRFLEGIACGCHVISRYENNSDTDFYELDKMTCNIRDYQQFEREMDRALSESVNKECYNDYMLKHYTSTVAKLLNDCTK